MQVGQAETDLIIEILTHADENLPDAASADMAHSVHKQSEAYPTEAGILPEMCYSEHVFHSVCGHWGLTRVYQKCPNADRVGFGRGCWNRQSTGSVSVNSSCDGCLFNPEATTHRGTYFSLPSSD
jgi:hypothetical protein